MGEWSVRTGWVWKRDFCYTRGIFGKMSAEGLKSWISGQEVVNQKSVRGHTLYNYSTYGGEDNTLYVKYISIYMYIHL